MYIDLIEEALKEGISNPRTMLKFLQAAVPCLNVHTEGGTSEAENHTNDGRYFSIYPLNLCFFLFFPLFLNPLTLMSDQSSKQSKRLKARKTDFKPYLR